MLLLEVLGVGRYSGDGVSDGLVLDLPMDGKDVDEAPKDVSPSVENTLQKYLKPSNYTDAQKSHMFLVWPNHPSKDVQMKKLLVALGIAALSTGAMAQTISYVDISSAYNGRLQNSVLDGIFLPSDVSYVGKGDVQFKVDGAGNNYWNSAHQPGIQDVPGGGFDTPATVEFSTNSYGVRSAYSLINTYWGNATSSAKASIEFFGTNGAYYKKNLIGNVDIRDWNQFVYTNDINGTTTVNVLNYYSPGTHRMDMQEYFLPEIFATETLTSIRLTDNRFGQNLLLSGLALRTNNPGNNAVPEPSEWAAMGLLGTGLLGLVVRGRKKKLAN